MRARPLSVAVLVELQRSPASGGHVKCWEHFAAAAADVPGIDLTVFVLGRRPGVDVVAGNVRFVALRPVLSSAGVGGLVGGVDAADLAPYHPALARALPRHDLWHVTHCLAFASTAVRASRRLRRPLVGSVHTDVPALTRTYTGQVVDHLGPVVGRAARATGVDRLPAALAQARRDRVLRACRHVLVSSEADRREIADVVPAGALSSLRRSVDTSLFAPQTGDRAWLEHHHGVPVDEALVLFVGRVDDTKGVTLLARAVHLLRAERRPVHLVVAGRGASRAAIARLLGPGVSLLGTLPQQELARVYASCDVMAFPSWSETSGNVVAEAMASGLPVVLPRGARTQQWLAHPGLDGQLVDGDDAPAWARALRCLLDDDDARRAMGRRALATARTRPTWLQVLHEDLLPVWEQVASRGAPQPARTPSRRTPGAVARTG